MKTRRPANSGPCEPMRVSSRVKAHVSAASNGVSEIAALDEKHPFLPNERRNDAHRQARQQGTPLSSRPPRVEEIVAVMKAAGDRPFGQRLRGLIVVLWRAGLRISEALALSEGDLEVARGSLIVRRGKGGRRREVGMDDWAWGQLRRWLETRRSLPIGPLFCVIAGPSCGRPWSSARARTALHERALKAGVRRRFAPHQLRHAHAVEMAREGLPINVIQRQLGHANLGVTSIYLQGIDSGEIIETVRSRRAPVIPATAALVD